LPFDIYRVHHEQPNGFQIPCDRCPTQYRYLGWLEGDRRSAFDENLGAALKAVMDMVKANPVGVSDQAQFEAGYQE
jgi:hypothetical protein